MYIYIYMSIFIYTHTHTHTNIIQSCILFRFLHGYSVVKNVFLVYLKTIISHNSGIEIH